MGTLGPWVPPALGKPRPSSRAERFLSLTLGLACPSWAQLDLAVTFLASLQPRRAGLEAGRGFSPQLFRGCPLLEGEGLPHPNTACILPTCPRPA